MQPSAIELLSLHQDTETTSATILANALFTIITFVMAAALFYLAVHQAMLQWEFRIPFPYWDMFATLDFLDHVPRPNILDIYHLYRDNEHRTIVPFIFYLWDRHSYGDSGAVLYPAIMVSNALLAASLFGILAVRGKFDIAQKTLFAAIVVFSFFSIVNYENLTWQHQVHVILSLTLLSFGLLIAATVSTRADSNRSTPVDSALALVSGFLCLAATYSFGFGLAAWPAVVVHGLLTRWRWPPLLIFAATAAFAIVTYALTYTVLATHTDPTKAAQEPLTLVVYVLHVIAGVLPSQTLVPIATVAAALAVILAIVLIVGFYVVPPKRPAIRSSNVVAGHAAMLIIASLCMALMVALGRMTVNSGGNSRYAVIGFIFWCALLILLLMVLRRRAASIIVLMFGLFALAVGYLPQRDYQNLLRVQQQNMYRAGVMATDRLQYWPNFPALFYDGQLLDTIWHKPRPPFQSFAEREPFRWIGATLSDLPPAPASNRCFGVVDTITPLAEAPRVVSLSGWAFIAAPDAHLRWVVVTDASNRGLGVGKTGLARPDVRAAFAGRKINENAKDQNYSGYLIAAVREPGEQMLLWGIDDAGRACRFGGPVGREPAAQVDETG
jgi:hypothetical protein